jgi:uncharacterized protein (DUF58 family)
LTSSEATAGPVDSAFAALRRRWQRWLDRRIPPASTVTLNQRRIFIFPSATGFFFGLALLLMLVAGINYQNNTAYALTFLLANLFVVAVLHSYANLSGLTLTAVGAEDAFPGQRAAFRLRLRCNNRRGHFALRLGWAVPAEERRRRRFLRGLFSTPEMLAESSVDLEPGTQQECCLYLPVGGRGWYRPGRLRLESVYPLGLLRCWTWVDLDLRALVYPEPRAGGAPRSDGDEGAEGDQVGGSGDDEFFGLRDYREGDSPRRVYWKGLARGQELQSKEFAAAVSDERWLDWQQFPGLGAEQRLSALCFWVLAFEEREQEYGLRIPGTELSPGCGERQRERALRALALYGVEEDAGDAP